MKQLFLIALITIWIAPNKKVAAQSDISRFESQIAAFEEEDEENGLKEGSVLFTGSSSIRRWNSLSTDMAPIPVLNRGFGGSTIPEVLHYADRIILPQQPEILVLYCGENDLANDAAKPSLVLKSFKNFYQYMSNNLPETEIYFIAIKPSIKRWHYWPKIQKANDKIARYIDKKSNCHFIDTASKMLDAKGVVLQDIFVDDDLHMNEKGYRIWTMTIKPVIKATYSDR